MPADITLMAGVELTPEARAVIQSLGNKQVKIKHNFDDVSGSLGRIRAQLGEFDKSLAASNARVLAFGASAGAMYAVGRSIKELVKSTVEVEKRLTGINTILGASRSEFSRFGNELFRIAQETSSGFGEVADAAEELARQGNGIEETLKRTSSAMKLVRISGITATGAVEALTAALNSNNDVLLTSESLINKLAAVDAKFAVSAAGLSEAIKRVGSVAADAGFSIDDLIAAVTSAQQTTARGEAVIGNSLKTIFTRAQRPKVLEDFESLGIATKNAAGSVRPLKDILVDLAKQYDNLSSAQQSSVSELVGGVYQINILKALFKDLGKETSVFGRALSTSLGSSNEASQRVAELNETLDSLFKRFTVNLTKFGSQSGNSAFAPLGKSLLKGMNSVLEGVSTEVEDKGSFSGKLFEGIFKGIGSALSGPVLLGGLAVFIKLFRDMRTQAGDALRTLAGLNTAIHSLGVVTANADQFLKENPRHLIAMSDASRSAEGSTRALTAAVADYVKWLSIKNEKESFEGRAASSVATLAARQGVFSGQVAGQEKIQIRKASVGLIPEMAEKIGAYSGGYTPGNVRQMNVPGMGQVYYNTAENVKQFPGMAQPAIMPPKNSKAGLNYQRKFGERHGFDPYAAGGMIPGMEGYSQYLIQDTKFGTILPNAYKNARMARLAAEKRNKTYGAYRYNVANKDSIKLSNYTQSISNPFNAFYEGGRHGPINPYAAGGLVPNFAKFNLPKVKNSEIQKRLTDAFSKGSDYKDFYSIVGGAFSNRSDAVNFGGIASALSPRVPDYVAGPASIAAFKHFQKTGSQNVDDYLDLPINGSVGNYKTIGQLGFFGPNGARRAGLKKAITGQTLARRDTDKTRHYAEALAGNEDSFPIDTNVLRAVFGKTVEGTLKVGSAKRLIKIAKQTASELNISPRQLQAGIFKGVNSRHSNKYTSEYTQGLRQSLMSNNGLVPNFSALSDSVSRESQSVNSSLIRVGSHSELRGPGNPDGLGIYNLRDEPLGLGQGVERAKNQGLNPKTHGIPNFAPFKTQRDAAKDYIFGNENSPTREGMFTKAITASMIAPMVTSMTGSGDSRGGKVATELTDALSLGLTIAAFARGKGGGKIAAGAGIVAGAMGVMKQWTASISGLNGDVDKLKDQLRHASEGLGKYGQVLEQLQSAYLDNSIGTDKIVKLQDKLAESLAMMPDELRKKLLGAKSLEQVQQIGSDYAESKEGTLAQKELALGIEGRLNSRNYFRNDRILDIKQFGTTGGTEKLNDIGDAIISAMGSKGLAGAGGAAGLGSGDFFGNLKKGGVAGGLIEQLRRIAPEEFGVIKSRVIGQAGSREQDVARMKEIGPEKQRFTEQVAGLNKRIKSVQDVIKQTFEQIGQTANLRLRMSGRDSMMKATGINEQIQGLGSIMGDVSSPDQAALTSYRSQLSNNRLKAAGDTSEVFGDLRSGILKLFNEFDTSRTGDIPKNIRAGQSSLLNILGSEGSVGGIGDKAISLFKSLGKDDGVADIKKLMNESNEKLVDIQQTLKEGNKIAEIQRNVAMQRAEFERTLKTGGGLSSFLDRGDKYGKISDVYGANFGYQSGIFKGQGAVELVRSYLGAGGKTTDSGVSGLLGTAKEERALDIIETQKDLNRAFAGTGLQLGVPNLSDARKQAETQIAKELGTGDSAMEREMAGLERALQSAINSSFGGQMNDAAQTFANVLAGSTTFQLLNNTLNSNTKVLSELDSSLKSLKAGNVSSSIISSTKAGGNIPMAAAGYEKMMAKAGGYNPGSIRRAGNLIYNSAERVDYLPGVREPIISPPPGSLAGFLHRQNFKGLGFAAEGKDLSDYLARVNSSNFPENIRAHLVDQGARMRPEQLNKIHDIYYKKHFGTEAPPFVSSSQASYVRPSWQTNGNTGSSNRHAEKVAETLRRKASEADFNANSYGRRGAFETSAGFQMKAEEAMNRQAANADFNANSGGRRGVFNMPNSSLPGSAEAQQRIIQSQIKIQERAMGIPRKFTEASIKGQYNLRPAAYSNVVTSQGENFIGPRMPVAQSNIANNFYGPTQYDRAVKMARQVGVGGGIGLGFGAYEAVKGLTTIKGGSEAARAGNVGGVAMETAGQALSYLGAAAAVPTSLAPTLAPIAGAIASGAGVGSLLLGGAAAAGGIAVTGYQAIKAQNQASQAYRAAGLSEEQVAAMKESGQLEKSHLLKGYDKGKAGSFSRMTSGLRRQTTVAKNFIQTGFNGTADYVSEALTGANNPEEYSFTGLRRDWSRQMRERQESQSAQTAQAESNKAYQTAKSTQFQQSQFALTQGMSAADRLNYFKTQGKYGQWDNGEKDPTTGLTMTQTAISKASTEVNRDTLAKRYNITAPGQLDRLHKGLMTASDSGPKALQDYVAQLDKAFKGMAQTVEKKAEPQKEPEKSAENKGKLEITVTHAGNVQANGNPEEVKAMQDALNLMSAQFMKQLDAVVALFPADVRSKLAEARNGEKTRYE